MKSNSAIIFLTSCLVFQFILGGCSAKGVIEEKPEFDIDNYDYQGDPVLISCVYSENQTEFYQVEVIGAKQFPVDLIKKLNNGNKISVYVNGIAYNVRQTGATFKFALEWFKAADSNICYISYTHSYTKKGILDGYISANKLMASHSLHYAAKVIRDLIWTVHKQCRDEHISGCSLEHTRPNQITMLGQSFGANVAAQACLYIKEIFNGELVGKLIGVDPFGITALAFAYNQPMMARGQAAYVQIIHTDPKRLGTMLHTADIDIDVVNVPTTVWKNLHGFAAYMHMATAMKKLVLIAEENGDGHVFSGSFDSDIPVEEQVSKPNEVFIGIYGKFDENKRGKRFKISFHGNRTETLVKSINHVVTPRI